MQNDQKEHFTKEAKRERFIRLATIRTNSILDRLRILGHCANKSAYSYTEQDIDKIFNELEDELRLIKARFQGKGKRTITLS